MRQLEQRYHLLGPDSYNIFKKAEGTPPFSSYIADLAIREVLKNSSESCVVWDPYCGNGVILRTFAVLYRNYTNFLFASDIRQEATENTRFNLEQCSLEEYKHNDSFRSLLQEYGCTTNIPSFTFKHNALNEANPYIDDDSIDLLFADPPYEYMESYFEQSDSVNAHTMPEYLHLLLLALRRRLKDGARLGLILDKSENYEDIISETIGYKFLYKQILHPSYKNRILYLAITDE